MQVIGGRKGSRAANDGGRVLSLAARDRYGVAQAGQERGRVAVGHLHKLAVVKGPLGLGVGVAGEAECCYESGSDLRRGSQGASASKMLSKVGGRPACLSIQRHQHGWRPSKPHDSPHRGADRLWVASVSAMLQCGESVEQAAWLAGNGPACKFAQLHLLAACKKQVPNG